MQNIQFVQTDFVREPYELADQYQFRSDRKFPWLQKVCFWVLRKLGALALRSDLVIKRNTIDTDKLFTLVLQQQYALYGKYLLESKYLLVGYDEYSKFMEETLLSPAKFTAPPHTYYYTAWDENSLSPRTDCKMVNGLQIVLVPWMKGVLVLPKEIL